MPSLVGSEMCIRDRGFGIAMLWLRDEDELEDEEWEEDAEDEWPAPPDEFPDESPPPIPPGLEDVDEEEE